MERTRLMTVAAMGVMLVGGYLVGTMLQPGPTPGVKPPKHDCADGGDCRVKVDPTKEFWVSDPVVIFGHSGRNIFFDVVPNDYKFVSPGIKVDAPLGKFDCAVIAGDRTVKCKFTRDKFGAHKYTIHVKQDSATKPAVYDPYLVNE